MDKLKILITGGNGYIGKSLIKYLSKKHFVTSINRNDFDLTDFNETQNWFNDKLFDVVIHTAISGGSRLNIDEFDVVDRNLVMYYNLLHQKEKYKKFINLGSGADTDLSKPYGVSKYVIKKSIIQKDNFYNIRIFGLFDENELQTRFIKGNTLRYINKDKMVIFENKKMDFYFMEDFLTLIDYYIDNDSPPKEIDCSYSQKFTLLDILNFINELDNYSVDIEILNIDSPDYVGNFKEMSLNLVGLLGGIKKTFNNLKKKIDGSEKKTNTNSK
jgi:nucleoside-diphosphate-sugar epimerase